MAAATIPRVIAGRFNSSRRGSAAEVRRVIIGCKRARARASVVDGKLCSDLLVAGDTSALHRRRRRRRRRRLLRERRRSRRLSFL